MFIRTERLFLRPGWPEDWRELLDLIDDEGIVRNLARAPWPYHPSDARDFAGKAQDSRLPHFFVTLPGAAGSQLIGSIGLGDAEDGSVQLGYWIARDHWNRGYATEASRAVLGLARTLGHRQMTARHFLDNPASGRVLRKVGFRQTGRITATHSLARSEPSLAALYAIDLGPVGDSDNPGGDDAMAGKVRRAA